MAEFSICSSPDNSKPEPKLRWVLFLVFGLFFIQITDAVLTARAISTGMAFELNPVMRSIMGTGDFSMEYFKLSLGILISGSFWLLWWIADCAACRRTLFRYFLFIALITFVVIPWDISQTILIALHPVT